MTGTEGKQAEIYRDPVQQQRYSRELDDHLTRTDRMDMVKQLLRLNEQADEGVSISPDLALNAVQVVYPVLLESMKEADTAVQDDLRSRAQRRPATRSQQEDGAEPGPDTSDSDTAAPVDRRGYRKRTGCECN
eukprot:COSAG01_NODE_5731_length_4070_cov_3.367666_5_plen_133_part_00